MGSRHSLANVKLRLINACPLTMLTTLIAITFCLVLSLLINPKAAQRSLRLRRRMCGGGLPRRARTQLVPGAAPHVYTFAC